MTQKSTAKKKNTDMLDSAGKPIRAKRGPKELAGQMNIFMKNPSNEQDDADRRGVVHERIRERNQLEGHEVTLGSDVPVTETGKPNL